MKAADLKFRGTVHGYEVLAPDGRVLGEIYKSLRHGYTYWRVSGTKNLFGTRNEAAAWLLMKREEAES